MHSRYAVLAGCAKKHGFMQKSILDFYRFLSSAQGGFWTGDEICIIPHGMSIPGIKQVLYRLFKNGIEQLLLYFCGTEQDIRTLRGFTYGGNEINLADVSDICPSQITIFDSCNHLYSPEETTLFLESVPVPGTSPAENNRQWVNIPRTAFFTGCPTGDSPVLMPDGSGVYTESLLAFLESGEYGIDFSAADSSARFVCATAQVTADISAVDVDCLGVKGC